MNRPKKKKKRMTSSCPHVTKIDPAISWTLIDAADKHYCSLCDRNAEEAWLCLSCLLCFGDHGTGPLDHSFVHMKSSDHPLTVNLKTGRFWCYSCGTEVFRESDNKPQFSIPQEGTTPTNWDLLRGENVLRTPVKGVVGLRNLGNTGYMNSALQCLSNCHAMTSYFLDMADYDILKAKRSRVSTAYRRMIKDMWSVDRPALVIPTELLRTIQSVNPLFRGFQQQDTQELLRCLIDHLHEELKHPVNYDPPTHLAPGDSDDSGLRSTMYDSVIADLFNGRIKSSVKCLYCEKISITKEDFQDLSLPIPSGDQLQRLHSKSESSGVLSALPAKDDGGSYLSWVLSPFSYLWGLTSRWSYLNFNAVTLVDCLSAFFSADELTGDNMYSCETCKKLRNGEKRVSIVRLPEVMSIHLKRFRHDFMNSSKISSYVSFPVRGLDVEQYVKQGSEIADSNTIYNLTGVIIHHGSVAGGHYTAYALHPATQTWFEYDDSYATQVAEETVAQCQAYVLFYTKDSSEQRSYRERFMSQIRSLRKQSLMRFYVSKHWMFKFLTCSDPGQISNGSDFLCVHGDVRPTEYASIDDLVVELSSDSWHLLHQRYGGGPAVSTLTKCKVCQRTLDQLEKRKQYEKETFLNNNGKPVNNTYAISLTWFRKWEAFVEGKREAPPGPIDNKSIVTERSDRGGRKNLRSAASAGQYTLRRSHESFGSLSGPNWRFLKNIYGGGPEAIDIRGDLEESEDEADVGGVIAQPVMPSEDEDSRSTASQSAESQDRLACSPAPVHSSQSKNKAKTHKSRSRGNSQSDTHIAGVSHEACATDEPSGQSNPVIASQSEPEMSTSDQSTDNAVSNQSAVV